MEYIELLRGQFTRECNSKLTIENWFGNILQSCKGFKAKTVHEIFFGDAVYAYDENCTPTYACANKLASTA